MRAHHAFLCLVAAGIAGLLAFPPVISGSSAYHELVPGLERTSLEHAGGGGGFTLEVLRIDPRRVRLRVLDARELERKAMTAREFCSEFGALAAANGGFFLEDMTPLGLLICDGRQTNPLRKVDWGVFALSGGRASIVHTRDFTPSPTIEQALQSGPRLIVDGTPVKLKHQVARRTAIGIDGTGAVHVVATRRGQALAADLAALLARPPSEGGLGLTSALNLDGGPSTQLYAKIGELEIDVPGAWGVPTAVGMFSQD